MTTTGDRVWILCTVKNQAGQEQNCTNVRVHGLGVEELAVELHEVYWKEAVKQGDAQNSEETYAELPEKVKDFYRVLARYVLELKTVQVRDDYIEQDFVKEPEEVLTDEQVQALLSIPDKFLYDYENDRWRATDLSLTMEEFKKLLKK